MKNNTMKKNHEERQIDRICRKVCSFHKPTGSHFNYEDRLKFARGWNLYLKTTSPISFHKFAKIVGLSPATVQREYKRGGGNKPVWVKDRYVYGEYDPDIAQNDALKKQSGKGIRQKLTNIVAAKFEYYVLVEGCSPYDARCKLLQDFPDKEIPCLRTFYNYIDRGELRVQHGDTPYHPDEKRKSPRTPHPAKTNEQHRSMDDRDEAANNPTEVGHYEMDTIVSCSGGKGGLLVLIDRFTKFYLIERIPHISQKCVMRALRKLRKKGYLQNVKSITTDNGCEFSSQKKLDKFFGKVVYYTRAYAAWEKGCIENCNRIVRRWYPKGTDFSKVSNADIKKLMDRINSIHRASLGGATAFERYTLFSLPA